MSMLETALAYVGGATGLAGIIGAGVQTVRSRADVAKHRAAAELARAEADRTEARTRESMTNLVAEQLGEAKGNLSRALEAADSAKADAEAAKRERAIATGKHAECEERVEACETKHAETSAELGAAKGTIAVLDTTVTDLTRRVEGIKRALGTIGISEETLRRMTPVQAMPAVKPPDGGR